MLKDFRLRLSWMAQDYQMGEYYDNRRSASNAEAYAWAIIVVIRQFIGSIRCRISGCELIDDSYGGPDRGYISMYCDRCGYSYHHILY
jgi:hypothetical protein